MHFLDSELVGEIPAPAGRTLTSHPVTSESLFYIADNMRFNDREEVHAALGIGPDECLLQASVLPSSQVLWYNGEPIAMYGCNAMGIVGVPWLLGTDTIEQECPVAFLRWSKRTVAEWSTQYRCLFNYTYAPNTETHRWLTWLGFTVNTTPVPMGPHGKPFYQFSKGN